MKKLLLLSIISLTLANCSSYNTQPLEDLGTVNALSVTNEKPNDVLKVPASIRIIKKSVKLKNTLNLKKLIKTSANTRSTNLHIDYLKNALESMRNTDNYNDAVNIGRKAATNLVDNLEKSKDPDYDMKNITGASLAFVKGQKDSPNSYDEYAVINEYTMIELAFDSIITVGESDSGNPKNLAIFTNNVKATIEQDNRIPADKIKRDSFNIGSFVLKNYYKDKSEYADYKDLVAKTLKAIENSASVDAARDQVFQAIAAIIK